MKSFTTSLLEIIPEVARSGAVCVNPLQKWRASGSAQSDDLRISATEQALLHSPLLSKEAHKKLFQHQRRYRETPSLVIQNECGKLQETPFVGSTKMLTVCQHRRIAMDIENHIS